MEAAWLKEALFAGTTFNGFKLGTVLTLGWFWPRVAGCSVLYRGHGMEMIDFTNILAVAETDACQISPPSYIPHNSGSTYFYVVRRVNTCGDQERTLGAAVKVSIDSSGELAQPQPNSVLRIRAEQIAGSKILLLWYYYPLEQKSAPVCFKIYYDEGMGQIDYENPIATINYAGRAFYSYESETLNAKTYLFAIRAEGPAGIENGYSARIGIQLDTAGPTTIDILGAEAV